MGCSRSHHPLDQLFGTSPKITKASQFQELLGGSEDVFNTLSVQQRGRQRWQYKR